MNWIVIRNLGKVKYFNISYAVLLLVPIVIELINKINDTEILKINELPNTLKLAYLASLLYALAIAIYQFFCPDIIKNYVKWQDYFRDNFEILNRDYVELKIQVVLANLNDNESELLQEIESLIIQTTNDYKDTEAKEKLKNLVDQAYPRCNQRSLKREFEEATVDNKIAIYLSSLFYIGGTLVMLYLLFSKSYSILIN